MKDLKKNLLLFSNRFWPLLAILFIIFTFFWKVFLLKQVPLPADFIVGVYYPWLDYKWGTVTGVTVKNPITTDVVSFTYPMQTLAMKLVKSIQPPLWNPYILAGSPLLANFQSAPFAPTSFVYFLFNKTTAWSLQIVLQHLLAAVFTYLLLRYWKVSKYGAILGGVVFAFSGYNLIFSQWNGHTLASVFIPLVLLFEDRLLAKKKFSDGFGLSVSLALQFFSGYTQTSVYTVIAMGLLWLVRMFRNNQIFSKTSILAIFCFFALGLSAIQILPSLELISNSQRDFEPHPYEWSFLPWQKAITFVAADFFGNHTTHNYWGPQDYTSNTGYVGVVAMSLPLLPLPLLKKKKELLYCYLLALFSLLLSFPTPLSIFIWSKNILSMRANSAHRATELFTIAIALLTAFGFDAVKSKLKFKHILLAFLIPTILLTSGLIYAYILRNQTIFSVSVFTVASRNLILPFLVLLLTFVFVIIKRLRFFLLLLLTFELFYFGWKFTPFSPSNYVYPETPILHFLTEQQKPFRTTGTKVIPSNLRMAYGIEAPEGYDTFHPLNMSRFIAAINSGTTKSLPVGRYGIVDNDTSPLLDLVNTKYYLALKKDEARFTTNDRFKLVFSDKSVDIFESTSVLPRAFMVYDWEVEADDIKVLDKLLDPKYPISKKIILRDSISLQPYNNTTIPKNSVNYAKYADQESNIKVETSQDGLLFISDTFYPGWNAEVDGVETKIYKADTAFRAVEIPKGKHEVKFFYHPDSFYNGLKISVISFLILIVIFIAKRISSFF